MTIPPAVVTTAHTCCVSKQYILEISHDAITFGCTLLARDVRTICDVAEV